MIEGIPERFLIVHDDYHAKFIGKTADGRQFFQTTPFVPASGESPGREYLALFLFDSEGHLLEYIIDDLGPRATLDSEAATELQAKRLRELGEIEFGDIEIAPFEVQYQERQFGLVAQKPQEEEEEPWVEIEPGNYMAFNPPWDGYYDT